MRPRNLAEEVAQHGFGHFVIGDDAVAQRAQHLDMFRVTPVHIARFLADGDDALFLDGERDHRRLLQNNLAACINHDVVRAEIDTQFLRRRSPSCTFDHLTTPRTLYRKPRREAKNIAPGFLHLTRNVTSHQVKVTMIGDGKKQKITPWPA